MKYTTYNKRKKLEVFGRMLTGSFGVITILYAFKAVDELDQESNIWLQSLFTGEDPDLLKGKLELVEKYKKLRETEQDGLDGSLTEQQNQTTEKQIGTFKGQEQALTNIESGQNQNTQNYQRSWMNLIFGRDKAVNTTLQYEGEQPNQQHSLDLIQSDQQYKEEQDIRNEIQQLQKKHNLKGEDEVRSYETLNKSDSWLGSMQAWFIVKDTEMKEQDLKLNNHKKSQVQKILQGSNTDEQHKGNSVVDALDRERKNTTGQYWFGDKE